MKLLCAFVICPLLLLLGCSQKPASSASTNAPHPLPGFTNVNVDNGSPDDWRLYIDGKDCGALNAHTVIGFELPTGKHEFRITRNAEEIDRMEAIFTEGKDTIINPAGLSRYRVITATYSTSWRLTGDAPRYRDIAGERIIEADYGLLQALPETIDIKSMTIKVKGVGLPDTSEKTATRTKLWKVAREQLSTSEALAILAANPNVYYIGSVSSNDTTLHARAIRSLGDSPPRADIRDLLLKFANGKEHVIPALSALKSSEADLPAETLSTWQNTPCTKYDQACNARATFAERVLLSRLRGVELRSHFTQLSEEKRMQILWAAAQNGTVDFRKELILATVQHPLPFYRANEVILAILRKQDFLPDEDVARALDAFILAAPDKTSSLELNWREDILIKRAPELRGQWFTQRLLQLVHAGDTMAMDALIKRDDGATLAPILPKLERRRSVVEWQANSSIELKKVTPGALALFRAALTSTDTQDRTSCSHQLARIYRDTKNATVFQWLQWAATNEKDPSAKAQIDSLVKWATIP